ncbi:GNAT family N-acetyltransferase [Halomonas sp.]|uniref:GNAT family N-acetyltransferase n=1 Tax=Halomonas sp. TaxID=1486246 RepID=UPI003F915C9D
MSYSILKSYNDISDYISQVSLIADENKESFGFLPKATYDQMAAKNQLWVAVNEEGELKGYLMFGGTMPTLKVFQIYACNTVKGHGVGKKLIDSLKEYGSKENYHTISAKVASDLSANCFWDSVGFVIHRQINGSKAKKRIINIRGFSLKENDLFGDEAKEVLTPVVSSPVLARSIYALDLNLLFDIVQARKGFEDVVKLMKIGFQGAVTLCVTPEFKNELRRQSFNFKDDAILRLAEVFPELRVEEDVSALIDSLRDMIFPFRSLKRKGFHNDESDLRHLAYCIFLKVEGFVTREKALLKAYDKIKDEYGVAIVSPYELTIDEEVFNSPLNSDFRFEVSSCNSCVRNFVNSFSIPEGVLNIFFKDIKFGENEIVYEAKQDGCLFGVCVFQKPVKNLGIANACLYIDEGAPHALAAIDHFIEKALRYKAGFAYRLDFYIGKGQDVTEQTLLKKGFFKSGERFVKVIFDFFVKSENWPFFAKEFKSLCGLSFPKRMPAKKELLNTGVCFSDSEGNINTLSWFDFETIISPRFILNSTRECTLVAIRENYANGLIAGLTDQLSLLPSYEKLLLLEKAYFRSSNKSTFFPRGGIVAFYVSGQKSAQEIIGFARITYSALVTVNEALLKVDRQGVLSREELISIADRNGRLHVFTFDNFLEFDRRVPFKRAKSIGLISKSNLVSPERLGPKGLSVLVKEAFNE